MTLLSGCDVINQLPGSTTTSSGTITQAEAAEGIKQALSQGLAKAVLQLNKQDGFYGDAFYKILLPPDAQKIEKTLRGVGLGSAVDKAILQINRGAEDAAGYARPIFADAIREMTLTDAINIVLHSYTGCYRSRIRTPRTCCLTNLILICILWTWFTLI